MEIKTDLTEHKDNIDKKLIRRLRIFFFILCAMIFVSIYQIFVSDIHFLWVCLSVVLGIAVGLVAGRMFSIEWHEEQKVVVGRLDLIGGIVLVLYILFSIARHSIFEHWFTGAKLSAFTLCFVDGAMLGRITSMRFHIKKVLREQGKM